MSACPDRTHRPWWYVTQWWSNRSAFNGYRATPSDYSEVWCPVCPTTEVWRTDAGYVYGLKDAADRIVPSTCRELAVICPHLSWSGAEGPVLELGRWPVLWECDGCGTLALMKNEVIAA